MMGCPAPCLLNRHPRSQSVGCIVLACNYASTLNAPVDREPSATALVAAGYVNVTWLDS